MIITIGGTAGGGKSSVGNALAKKLGYKRYSAGDVRREYAKSKNITLAELNKEAERDPYSDELVDTFLKNMGEKEDNFVIDCRLGFYFIPKSIKIFLDADLRVRAKRTLEKARFEECPEDLKQAAKVIKEREASDVKRYEKLYSVNCFDNNHFDLVIDTTKNTVEQTTDVIYRFVMTKIENGI